MDIVLTLFFSLAAWRLAQKNILTSRFTVLESLGSITVLCTDKTGTHTQNKMSVKQMLPFDVQSGTLSLMPTNEHLVMMQWKKLKQIYPITGSCFAMAHLYTPLKSSYNVFCKGAPEAIMALCKIDPVLQTTLLATLNLLATDGQRLLGFARAMHHE
jgi:Ca2+-transporting ATPase